MKNTARLCLFAYYTLFYVESAVKEGYFNCHNSFVSEKNPVRYAVLCESFENKTLALPQTVPTNIHILNIISYSYGVLIIENVDTFKRFPNLLEIAIKTRKGLEISDNLLEPNQLKILRNELFDAPSLKYLEMFYAEFNVKNHNWILPGSLKFLRIVNSVLEYDLNKCSQLETLELIQNELRRMPILSNPAPPLKALDLSSNPLREFEVNDIAGYCGLRIVILNGANMSFCECFRLINWLKKNIEEVEGFEFGGVLECEHVEGRDCSNYTLQEAEILRDKCIEKRLWNVITWVAIAAFIIVTIFACFFFVHKLINTSTREMNEYGEE